MAKKSGLLERQKQDRQAYVALAERVTRQIMLDCAQIVLHSDEFRFGYDRVLKFTQMLSETVNIYFDALLGGPEADYLQEKLDANLQDILKDRQELIPFDQRYPDIKKIQY